jgi:hypothetical protein
MLNLKTTALFFIAVMAPMAMLAGCGSGLDTGGEPSSSLLLSLTIVEGVDIDEVLWRVSGGDMEDMLGTIDTSAPGSTASVELFGFPEGTGYLVEMEALSALADFYCSGSTSFDVTVGVATPVDVTLSCRRECNVLVCGEQGTNCTPIDLPDGTSCVDGAGVCVGGACELPGF